MDVKELIVQLIDIVEEKGNMDIAIELLGNEYDFEIKKKFPDSDFEDYVLKVIE